MTHHYHFYKENRIEVGSYTGIFLPQEGVYKFFPHPYGHTRDTGLIITDLTLEESSFHFLILVLISITRRQSLLCILLCWLPVNVLKMEHFQADSILNKLQY